MKHTIAIVDDHQLVAKAFAGLIEKYDGYIVLYEVENGKALMRNFRLKLIPEIVLLDTSMPEMDGYETALWLKNHHPEVKVLALSMNDKEEAIIGMIRNGACGYLLKGCSPIELKNALDLIIEKGFYYSEFVTIKLVESLKSETEQNIVQSLGLNERELDFIKLSCSELTYNEIAGEMCVASRTVDGYREAVFTKMKVKSRVGMVLFALRMKIINL